MEDGKEIQKKLRRAPESEQGAGMVEYALIVALICVIAIPSLVGVGEASEAKFDYVAAMIATGGVEPEAGPDPP